MTQHLRNTCKHILSQKSTGIIFLVIAIIIKLFYQFALFSIADDKSAQLAAAQNLLSGHGITISQLAVNDLSTEPFTPLVGWPPGYSLLMAPLLWIFKGDYISAAVFFDLLSVLPFFFYLIKLLRFLAIRDWLRNLFILFVGFFPYPATSSTSTDFICTSFTLAGLYYMLQFMRSGNKGWRLILFAGFAFFLAAFFRYNYIPVIFCCPVLLMMAGYFNKNRTWIRGGLKMGAVVWVLLVSLLLFQQYYTGAATYVNSESSGFYPENLLNMYPVVLSSLVDVQAPLSFISQFTGHYFLYGAIIMWGSYAILVSLSLYGLYKLVKNKFRLINNASVFFYAGLCLSAAIVCSLIYLSLRNSSHFTYRPPWTYLQEPRYFIFPIVFVQLMIFAFLFENYKILSLLWKKVALISITIILGGFVYSVFSTSRLLFFSNAAFYSLKTHNSTVGPIQDVFKDVKNKYPSYEIVVASEDNDICNYARLEKIKVINQIPSPTFRPAAGNGSKIKILISILKYNSTGESQLPATPPGAYVTQTQNHYFYILDVTPLER